MIRLFQRMAGLPALSLPCGFDGEGLPIGVQIIGQPWAEDKVLAAAAFAATAFALSVTDVALYRAWLRDELLGLPGAAPLELVAQHYERGGQPALRPARGAGRCARWRYSPADSGRRPHRPRQPPSWCRRGASPFGPDPPLPARPVYRRRFPWHDAGSPDETPARPPSSRRYCPDLSRRRQKALCFDTLSLTTEGW